MPLHTDMWFKNRRVSHESEQLSHICSAAAHMCTSQLAVAGCQQTFEREHHHRYYKRNKAAAPRLAPPSPPPLSVREETYAALSLARRVCFYRRVLLRANSPKESFRCWLAVISRVYLLRALFAPWFTTSALRCCKHSHRLSYWSRRPLAQKHTGPKHDLQSSQQLCAGRGRRRNKKCKQKMKTRPHRARQYIGWNEKAAVALMTFVLSPACCVPIILDGGGSKTEIALHFLPSAGNLIKDGSLGKEKASQSGSAESRDLARVKTARMRNIKCNWDWARTDIQRGGGGRDECLFGKFVISLLWLLWQNCFNWNEGEIIWKPNCIIFHFVLDRGHWRSHWKAKREPQ